MVESIYIYYVWLCLGSREYIDYSREYWLFDLTLAERKRRIGYPYRSCRTSVPLFSGSGANLAPMDLENEYEPNDDYESYAMRQRIQPHGGQLMMTTQVTTKVPPGFDGKTSWFVLQASWMDFTCGFQLH